MAWAVAAATLAVPTAARADALHSQLTVLPVPPIGIAGQPVLFFLQYDNRVPFTWVDHAELHFGDGASEGQFFDPMPCAEAARFLTDKLIAAASEHTYAHAGKYTVTARITAFNTLCGEPYGDTQVAEGRASVTIL